MTCLRKCYINVTVMLVLFPQILYDQRLRSPDGQQRLSSHPWMYFTPPTKSSRNHTKYDEDDVNGVTREKDIGNVGSNEKGQESGHFVDMCDTTNKDETDTDESSNTAEHVGDIRPSHFRRKPFRRSACWFYADGRCRSGNKCHFSHDGPLNRKEKLVRGGTRRVHMLRLHGILCCRRKQI